MFNGYFGEPLFLQYHNPQCEILDNGIGIPHDEHTIKQAVPWYDNQEDKNAYPQQQYLWLGYPKSTKQLVNVSSYEKAERWCSEVYNREIKKVLGEDCLEYHSEVNIKGLARIYKHNREQIIARVEKRQSQKPTAYGAKSSAGIELDFDYKKEIFEFDMRWKKIPYLDLDYKSYDVRMNEKEFYTNPQWYKYLKIENVKREKKYYRKFATLVDKLMSAEVRVVSVLKKINTDFEPFNLMQVLFKDNQYIPVVRKRIEANRDIAGDELTDKFLAHLDSFVKEQKEKDISGFTAPQVDVEIHTPEMNYWFTIERDGEYYLKRFPPYPYWSRYDYLTSSWVVDIDDWIKYHRLVGLGEISFNHFPFGEIPTDNRGRVHYIDSLIDESVFDFSWAYEGYEDIAPKNTTRLIDELKEVFDIGRVVKRKNFKQTRTYLEFEKTEMKKSDFRVLKLDGNNITFSDYEKKMEQEQSIKSVPLQKLADRLRKYQRKT